MQKYISKHTHFTSPFLLKELRNVQVIIYILLEYNYNGCANTITLFLRLEILFLRWIEVLLLFFPGIVLSHSIARLNNCVINHSIRCNQVEGMLINLVKLGHTFSLTRSKASSFAFSILVEWQ